MESQGLGMEVKQIAKQWNCEDMRGVVKQRNEIAMISAVQQRQSGAVQRAAIEWQGTELICSENKFGGKKNERIKSKINIFR